jgi:hypothetical protein
LFGDFNIFLNHHSALKHCLKLLSSAAFSFYFITLNWWFGIFVWKHFHNKKNCDDISLFSICLEILNIFLEDISTIKHCFEMWISASLWFHWIVWVWLVILIIFL